MQESISVMRDEGSEIFLISLDTRKAYDTVWHEDRISKAKKAFYAMCGLSSNLKMPLISLYVKFYWTICVSSMCYGCEVMSISDKNMELLESFHRNVAKRIQWLPDKCNSLMCLAGLGWWSLSAYMDIRRLLFLHSVLSKSPMFYKRAVIKKLYQLHNLKSKRFNQHVGQNLGKI